MSDENALLDAIWSNPHEDTPRLMYADWLQETGEPANVARAEFIRVQCELARLDEWDDADRIERLKPREAELWQLHRKTWLEGLPKVLHNASFRRGFSSPRRQRHPGAQFLKLKVRDFEAAPLWDFSLTGLSRNFDKVFASPLLGRTGTLMIDLSNYPKDALAKLADNDRLRHVADLELKNIKVVTPESVAAFFDGPAATAVTHLRFGERVSRTAVAALGGTRTAPRLRALALYMIGEGRRDAEPLFSADQFPHLRSLDVSSSWETLPGFPIQTRATPCIVKELTREPDTQLRRLDLSSCVLGGDEVEQLAAWPGLARLRWLNLSDSAPSAGGCRALARSPYVGNLKHLEVDGDWLRECPEVKAELDARFGKTIHYV